MLVRILKLPLKLFALLLFLCCSSAALLVQLAIRLAAYVIGPLMLFLLGCGIYTAVKQAWSQTLLLFMLEVLCAAALFGSAEVLGLLGDCKEKLLEFIRL